jgi:hypothetical protein
MKILIGSQALKKYVDIRRQPKDTDYFVHSAHQAQIDDILKGIKGVEVFSHPDITSWFGENEERVATLNELYTIKLSHIFWDLKNKTWEKHCYDIMTMQKAGAQWDAGLYTVLYKVWEEVHGKKKANLNMVPEDFFNKNVKRIYDHDSIHASIAYYDRPMFERILKDGHQIAVDMAKWDALSLEDKFKCVREEVYATALERQIIPSGYASSPRAAYQWSLKKTLTSFSKGWFALFIATHLLELWKPDADYVLRHKEKSDKLVKLGETK